MKLAMSGALALVFASACAAQAAATAEAVWMPKGQTSCSFGAFVIETDPAGLNVRAAPGTTSRILGTLPPVGIDPNDSSSRGMVEVQVTAGADGWFRVRNAKDNPELTGVPARKMFGGEGWVSGRKLTVKSQASIGRDRPASNATPVVTVREDGTSLDSDVMVQAGHLVGCSGQWALVEYTPSREHSDVARDFDIRPVARKGAAAGAFRAWVNKLCAVQETSCDG